MLVFICLIFNYYFLQNLSYLLSFPACFNEAMLFVQMLKCLVSVFYLMVSRGVGARALVAKLLLDI